jgi:hypothetical protein
MMSVAELATKNVGPKVDHLSTVEKGTGPKVDHLSTVEKRHSSVLTFYVYVLRVVGSSSDHLGPL